MYGRVRVGMSLRSRPGARERASRAVPDHEWTLVGNVASECRFPGRTAPLCTLVWVMLSRPVPPYRFPWVRSLSAGWPRAASAWPKAGRSRRSRSPANFRNLKIDRVGYAEAAIVAAQRLLSPPGWRVGELWQSGAVYWNQPISASL